MVETILEKPVSTDSLYIINLDQIVQSCNLFKGTLDEVELRDTCQCCDHYRPGVCLKNPREPIATKEDYYCKEPGKYKK